MKVLSLVNEKAYYPEIYAYKSYFNKVEGFEFEIINGQNYKDLYAHTADVYLMKVGLDPFYYKPRGDAIIIHDYASCSTGNYSKFKNIAKRLINKNAHINLFLNAKVRQEYFFKENSANLYRDMGVDESFYYNSELKGEHEVIYTGSIDESRNISKMIQQVIKSGLRISLVGTPSDAIYVKYKNNKQVNFLGRMDCINTAKEMKKAIYGINSTPNIYPYYFQTSTKILEYCAANLKIITNSHHWTTSFMQAMGGKFLVEDDFILDNINEFNFVTPRVDNYKWDNVITNSKLKDSILNLYNS